MHPTQVNFPIKMTLKQRVAHRISWWRWRYAVWCGYFAMDGEPLRCQSCDSWHWKDHKEYTVDTINGIACETQTSCKLCGHVMGYWAYGYWEPPYA